MAGRLRSSGFAVTLHDAVANGLTDFASEIGATVAVDVDGLSAVDVLICMLPNSSVVESVLTGSESATGLLDMLRPGVLVIDMGSSVPNSTRRLSGEAATRGLALVDGPVSGGVARAETGELTIMFGGSAELLERCGPIFEPLGRVVPVGPVGAGHAMKALNNLLSAVGLAAACEVMETGKRFGLDPTVMLDVLNHSTGQNYSTTSKVAQFIESGTFASGFAMQLMLKDMGIAVGLARALHTPTPVSDACLALWDRASHELPADADHTMISEMFTGQRVDN